MLELYEAYGDYETMMRLAEALIRACAMALHGSLELTFRERPLDLAPPFRRMTVLGPLSEATGAPVELDRDQLTRLAEAHHVSLDPVWGAGKIALELFEKLVEHTIFEPTFVCDFPREVSPLARPHRSDPALTEHFDVIVGGIELGTAFSELTDPIEQRAKFEEQAAQRAARRRRGPPAGRGLPDRARARHASHGRHRDRDRPAAHGAHRRAVAARSHPVPAPPPGEHPSARLRRACRPPPAAGGHDLYLAAVSPCRGAGGGDAMDEQAAIERSSPCRCSAGSVTRSCSGSPRS